MIDILLATWNGEKYLRKQLDSILNQTYQDFQIITRDDGSTDGTVKIMYDYKKKNPLKFKIIKDKLGGFGNPCGNFGEILKYSNSQYIAFCDQDDIWLDNKLELQMNKMMEIERDNGDIPIIVFSDSMLINVNGDIIFDSFWRYQKIDPRETSFISLLLENCVQGTATLFNAKARELGYPIPKEAIMHDWWLALVCSFGGIVSYIENKTVLYRQTGRNFVGANRRGVYRTIVKILSNFQGWFNKLDKLAAAMKRQAYVFNKTIINNDNFVNSGENFRVLNVFNRINLVGLKFILVIYYLFRNNKIRNKIVYFIFGVRL